MEWQQTVVVLALIWAAAHIAWRGAKLLFAKKEDGAACGGCAKGCGTKNAPQVVGLTFTERSL